MNCPTEAKSHFSALMIKKMCLLLQALTAWPSRESSLSGFPFGSSVAMTLLAMDALVERDLLSISAQPQGLKKTQRWRWICVIFFLEKLFQQQHLLLNRLCLLKQNKIVTKKNKQRPMPSTLFFLCGYNCSFCGLMTICCFVLGLQQALDAAL